MSGIIIALIVVSVLLVISLYVNYRLTRLMMDTEEKVSNMADVFDAAYAEISKILNLPVFFDSIEVREVIRQIEKCRDTVVYAQNVIADDDNHQ